MYTVSRAPSRAVQAVWARLSTEERRVYERAGYHRTFGLGKAPGLLIVDVEYNFTGDMNEPILDSMVKYSNSCGPAAWQAVPVIQKLLDVARSFGIPVVYTHGTPDSEHLDRPRRGTQIVDEIAPQQHEYVVAKTAASPFHGTDIADYFRAQGVDTILHTGGVTSGCVRAGVVDGAAEGFRNAVVEEAVFDRAHLPHAMSLFDMDAKYADVISLNDALQYLAGLGTQPMQTGTITEGTCNDDGAKRR
jgi:maleamate amidohydrolase